MRTRGTKLNTRVNNLRQPVTYPADVLSKQLSIEVEWLRDGQLIKGSIVYWPLVVGTEALWRGRAAN